LQALSNQGLECFQLIWNVRQEKRPTDMYSYIKGGDKMTKNIRILTTLLIITCMVLLLSACGRNNNDENDYNNGQETNEAGHGGVGIGVQLPQGTHTLSVSVPLRREAQFRRVGESLQTTLADYGIDLEFKLEYFDDTNWAEHFELLLSQYAAGVGPDIIAWDFTPLPLYRFVENNFLADIYTLIDNSPTTGRENFFANALTPHEIGGRLYTFPLQFNFDFIGINANVPPEFQQRFAVLDRATPSDLTQLYLDLISEHPQWGEFAFVHGLNAQDLFAPELNDGIDFSNSTANFTGTETTLTPGLLENIRQAFEGNNRFSTEPVFPITEDFLAELQGRYVFYRLGSSNGVLEAFVDFEIEYFANIVPMADESGRLVQSSFTGTQISVSHTADYALAWAFIELLVTDATTDTFSRINPDIPIARHYLESTLEISIRDIFGRMPRPFIGGQHSAVEQMMTGMTELSAMPTTISMIYSHLHVPIDAFFGFMEGETTGEQALQLLEDEIVAWMNTARPIAEYAPMYVDALDLAPEELDLPARTLSVFITNMSTGVFLQAAEAMNASWRVRGEPYVFELEIEEIPHTGEVGGWDAREAHLMRLQTQLMAGQGPDMFQFMEGQNIHTFVDSGLLVDFNTLMDNDPRTNRDDFFTEPLNALEIAGGLYVFPSSFGFEFVGINAGLPQSVIDQFTQHSTITVAQMLDIYLYLIDNYSEEFGHLIFGTSSGMSWPIRIMESVAGGFIDFNTRTANLTDPGFVSFLEMFKRVADGREIIQGWGVGPISDEAWLRQQSYVSVFVMESSQLTTANAHFTPANPIFAHYIPHADAQGRLLLTDFSWRSFNYGAFCVTTAGDSALAWEFIQYLIPAYTQPVGRAAIDPVSGAEVWGYRYLASPIQRNLFREHAQRAIAYYFAHDEIQDFVGTPIPSDISAAIDRIAELNEMPMAMMYPMLPLSLFEENFGLFMDGVLTPEDFAQRMQNSIALWLME